MEPCLRWDLFCRVIDHYGDVGVCWRLAADLGARGQHVRLWLDDPAPLAWMAPQGAAGVQVLPWTADAPVPEPGDVVIEAFGCDPPPTFVARMARSARPPVWINLEYLSAEDYATRCHGLPSPQAAGPGRGLRKFFFYPGFDAGTGGLIREPGLIDARQRFDRDAWLHAQGIAPRPGERVLSLFCYAGAPLPALVDRMPRQAPTLWLLTPGAAREAAPLLAARADASMRWIELPWLSQADYDRLLWACDLNFVRGEDSFVRAMWAAAPFVWHIYPQHDAAHAAKLDAFLDRFLAGADEALAAPLRALWQAWNGLAPWPARWPGERPGQGPGQSPTPAWRTLTQRWRDSLLAQPDLATQLLGFVRERR